MDRDVPTNAEEEVSMRTSELSLARLAQVVVELALLVVGASEAVAQKVDVIQ